MIKPKVKCPHCNHEMIGEQRMMNICPRCMQFITLTKQVNNNDTK